MQNLADSLTSRSTAALAGAGAGPEAEQALMERLSTFMVYNMRRKVGILQRFATGVFDFGSFVWVAWEAVCGCCWYLVRWQRCVAVAERVVRV